MQLIISHNIEDKLVLPINYLHILQSVIYYAIAGRDNIGLSYVNKDAPHNISHNTSDRRFNSRLHNTGYAYGDRKYKDFTFSWLRGSYRVSGKTITFTGNVSFEVRSTNPQIIHTIADNISRNGVTYLHSHYDNVSVNITDRSIESNRVLIKMITPVCVYSTDEDKHTIYYAPDEAEFYEMINDNFRRKYSAIMGVEPDDDIALTPVSISDRDCVVTRYKGFYITGYKGQYVLEGNRKYLDFLYQAGLGAKNSQGFGMFEWCNE